jgi:hypothetical protein
LHADERDEEQTAVLLHDRADVQLCTALPRAPHVWGALLLLCIEQQLRQLPPRPLDLVLVVAADLEELSRSGLRHKDRTGLAERWT